MRDQICSVGITALNSLLVRRKTLQQNIVVTERIIKRHEKNLSSEVMRQLHSGTVADMQRFKEDLANTETQISNILGFLDEVESDVRMALISDDGHAELDKRLLLFAGTIHSVKEDDRVVQKELNSFLGRDVSSFSESHESVPQTQAQQVTE